MAKFKVGDKVTDGSGVYLITGIDNGFGSYEWKLISGRADPSYSEGGDFGWADAKMKIANSCACNSTNPVVANAINACGRNAFSLVKVKPGDKVKIEGCGSLSGHTGIVRKIRKDTLGGEIADVTLENGYDEQVPVDCLGLNACGTARNAKYNHEHTPEVMRFIKAALDYLKKASSYVAFAEEMSPVASAIHSVEEAIRKLQ